ncbi:MAG: hypothetical protein ACREU7_08545 [Burkholderiales bacterium]
MPRWKLAIVLLMSLWLPAQGMAAVVMPFCKHSLSGSAGALHDAPASVHDMHPAGHADHEGMAQHGASGDHGPSQSLSACDDCGHCHLSAACTLPTAGFPDGTFVSSSAPSFTPSLPHGTAPHPLHRPPLPALS